MAKKKPTCDLCKNPVTVRIELEDHQKQRHRITNLCGTHAKPFLSNRKNPTYTVTGIVKVSYKGF
jgi:hypothetical protein